MTHRALAASAALLALSAASGAVASDGRTDLGSIGSACLETQLQACRVMTAGFINVEGGTDKGEPQIAWQTQSGFTPEDGVKGGFVLFTHDAKGWTLLDARFEGWYAIPVLNEEGQLHVAGYSGGTGAYNVDRLYQWGDLGYAVYREGWIEIEMHGWLETIGEKLPQGLEIWKGVRYDFRNPGWGLSASTALWQSADANCCPTGGDAVIALEIEDGRLVATAVRLLQQGERP